MKGKKIRPGKKIIVVGCHQEGTPTGQYKCNPEPSFWRYSGHVKQVLQTWNKGDQHATSKDLQRPVMWKCYLSHRLVRISEVCNVDKSPNSPIHFGFIDNLFYDNLPKGHKYSETLAEKLNNVLENQ